MNLESNTTPKINKQHLKSKYRYNNQQTLTNYNYTMTLLQAVKGANNMYV